MMANIAIFHLGDLSVGFKCCEFICENCLTVYFSMYHGGYEQ